ncbi:trichodiene oxygenase [Thozetella sp. PMI_491]|nr:trichodiene oxygenase [Thozetella sp. PMI_491]
MDLSKTLAFGEDRLLYDVVALVCLTWVFYNVTIAIYNVSALHPLYRFPGPRLAAMSWIYEFYFDVVHKGTYSKEIKRLHSIYGPIIRINPVELHCADTRFMDEIYAAGGRKRDRGPFGLGHLTPQMTLSTLATLDHDHHRRRREAMKRFFSRAHISKLETEVGYMAQRLSNKLLARVGSGKPFDITAAYSCFATDIISKFCFGESFGFLDQEDFEPNFRNSVMSFVHGYFILRFFPWLKGAIHLAPYIASYLPRDIALADGLLRNTIPSLVDKARDEYNGKLAHRRDTVFEYIFDSDLPDDEKSTWRLTAEGMTLMAAGTETSSWTLAVLTFYLLNDPKLLARLTEELKEAVPDPQNIPSLATLERLPLFGAVILEGLRLSYGVSVRSARVPTEEDLVYNGAWTPPQADYPVPVHHVIPRGSLIGMTTYITHHDESIFPASDKFKPERFLDENGQRRKDVEKHMTAFSKGSRVCLGMNLANCELYMGLAALVLRVFPHMRLHETSVQDVKYDHDLFIPMPKAGARGVRVLMV